MTQTKEQDMTTDRRGKVLANPEEFIPQPMPGYIRNPSVDDDLTMLLDMGCNVALLGDPAAGKTEAVSNYYAVKKKPLFQQSGALDLSSADMRGTPIMKDGTLEILYGPLALAMIIGGGYLLDEATSSDQSVLSTLFMVGDRRRMLYMPETGEMITAHPDFRLILIGNHIGTHVRDSLKDAIRSRFQVLHVTDSHTLNVAAANLAKESGVSGRDKLKAMAQSLVELCEEIRGLGNGDTQADARDLNRAREYMAYSKKIGKPETIGPALIRAFRGVSDDPTTIESAGRLVNTRFEA